MKIQESRELVTLIAMGNSGFDIQITVATLLLIFLAAVKSQSVITKLPGFDGDLPFKLETGYIGVGKNNEKQMFYYFIESERNPDHDPLILSIAGGPGCSSFSTLSLEFGPVIFDSSTFGWSLPSLVLNAYSWTKMSNIIFLDWPVGGGFSYSTTAAGYHTSDSEAPGDISHFLRNWLLNHPMFIKNRLYIQGESYGGKIAPMVAWEIAKANERGLLPQMSLHGYIVGNPGTFVEGSVNDRVPYAHQLGLISDKYFMQAERSCKGGSDKTNLQCQAALQVIRECLDGVDPYQILEPTCLKFDPFGRDRTFLDNNPSNIFLSSYNLNPPCRDMYRSIAEIWANNLLVRNALGIQEGTKGKWLRCNDSVAVDEDVISTVEYHLLLAEKGYHGLVYSGDHDMMVPYFGTLKWIQGLNLTLQENWRSWRIDGFVAGFTMRFLENGSYLTFATIKGAGHTAPEYNPKECFAMISRWLSGQPL